MPHEMAGGGMVKMKGGTGAWVCRMNHPPWTVEWGENLPEIRSQGAGRIIHHIQRQ